MNNNSKKYSEKTLQAIESEQTKKIENCMELIIKPLPYSKSDGIPSKELAKYLKPNILRLLNKSICVTKIQHPEKYARKRINKVQSIPITQNVQIKNISVEYDGLQIPVRIFSPKNHAENLPVLYYIHGGGFFAGSIECVSEICKLICQTSECVCITPDYRLTPENPYPCGFNDCYAVLEWAIKHIYEYGGNAEKICICGDSAGGNIAASCTIRCRDENKNYIKAQALIYPTLNIARQEDNYCRYDNLDIYKKEGKYKSGIEQYIKLMGNGMDLLKHLFNEQVIDSPYISPYTANLSDIPDTMLIYGEFDFLRIENEAFAKKLCDCGTDVKCIQFNGMSHGFISKIGVLPQAEICVNEICKFMKESLNRQNVK